MDDETKGNRKIFYGVLVIAVLVFCVWIVFT